MSITVVMLLCLLVGIIVSVLAGKLTVVELFVCGTFGLLLGGTPIGRTMNAAVISSGNDAVTALVGLLS